ncbi:MAG: DotH/IcmK family type IV secretion protein [Gammaproteobacteria bacterium]
MKFIYRTALLSTLFLVPGITHAALVSGASILPVADTAVDQKITDDQIEDAIANSTQRENASPVEAGLLSVEAEADRNKVRQPTPAQKKRDAAYNMLLEDALPLNPQQIKHLRKLYEQTEEATYTTPKAPPTPISSSMMVNLDPGTTPPIIRLSAGFVSSLVFTDVTGEPWPIVSYDVGDPKVFNIAWDTRSNTIFAQSLKLYAHGNLAVRLQDLPTPIMLSLISGGQREVDFRVDLQVTSRGPNAKPPIMSDSSLMPARVNAELINILDGVAPVGSLQLEVAGGQGKAWLSNKKLYFRSPLTVISPAWLSMVSSPDGTHVYEMAPTPLILASQDGRTVNIQIKGL